MDAYIKEALEEYSRENHGQMPGEYTRDTITWLIRRRAEHYGEASVEAYIKGRGLWDDLIRVNNPE